FLALRGQPSFRCFQLFSPVWFSVRHRYRALLDARIVLRRCNLVRLSLRTALAGRHHFQNNDGGEPDSRSYGRDDTGLVVITEYRRRVVFHWLACAPGVGSARVLERT